MVERLIQPSSVNVLPTSSEFASGTRPLSLTPSNEAAVSGSLVSAPGTPSVTPLRSVPLLPDGDESVIAVLAGGPPKRQ